MTSWTQRYSSFKYDVMNSTLFKFQIWRHERNAIQVSNWIIWCIYLYWKSCKIIMMCCAVLCCAVLYCTVLREILENKLSKWPTSKNTSCDARDLFLWYAKMPFQATFIGDISLGVDDLNKKYICLLKCGVNMFYKTIHSQDIEFWLN